MKEINPNDPNITLYHRLLNKFNDATNNWLVFEVGSTSNDNWGETSGSWLNSLNSNGSLPDTYNITISNTIDQNGSNLAKEITLIHELIHAYMFDTLSDSGVIFFDQNTGEPFFVTNFSQQWCGDGTNYNGVDLNDLDTAERFKALTCAMEASNTLNNNWTHELFNTNTFSSATYQQQLADFILENHDWDGENSNFISQMQSYFGTNNWQEKTAEAVSWIGLTNTQEYSNFQNSLTNPAEMLGIIQIAESRHHINDANSNCN